MTVVIDISCPICEQTGTVRKVGIGTYRCVDCDREFSQADVRPSDPV